MNQFNLISLILAAIFVGLCECRRVVWKQRSSMGDANNWVDNKVPCSSDALLFPESSYDLIKLSNFTMKEIILPKTGGFVLDARTSLSFRESDSKCKANETRTFKSVIETPWLSSSNWDITREPNSDRSTHFYNKATPHEERLPCDNDEIVFPVNNSYVVDLQSCPRLSFKSIAIDGRVLSVTEFRSFLSSEYGDSMFKNKDETLFIDSECLDESKCPCHKVKSSILDQLCQNDIQICEPVPHCSTPIKPIGHCCSECGAMFQAKLEKFRNFNLQTFKTKIEQGKWKIHNKVAPHLSGS